MKLVPDANGIIKFVSFKDIKGKLVQPEPNLCYDFNSLKVNSFSLYTDYFDKVILEDLLIKHFRDTKPKLIKQK